jgi:putative membrane protein
MTGFLARLVITALGLWVAATLLPGFRIKGVGNLLVAALLLGLVNAVVRPIVFLLTLPLTIVTLGLFILVVNGISIALVAWLVPGVTVSGLFAATLGALVVSLVSWFASSFVGSTGRLERFERRRIDVPGRRLD